MSDTAGQGIARPANAASLSALGLSALGVVFGDIGTSPLCPLYTLKTVLSLTGGAPDAAVTLGVLSLVIWTLIVVTTIKYGSVAMRVDNDGEGGILALMSLLRVKRQHRPIIIAFGLFGAALIYGDGAITPAISVLSALEGLDIDASAAQLALRAQAASSCLGPSQPALCFASPWGRLLCCRGRPGE